MYLRKIFGNKTRNTTLATTTTIAAASGAAAAAAATFDKMVVNELIR